MRKLMLMLGLGLSMAACNKDAEPGFALNDQDKNFVQQASYGNLAEVQAGKIAEDTGSATVAWFGMMMQTEHGEAQTELKSIAAHQTLEAPATTDSMHMMQLDMLRMLSDRAFDSTYVHMQVAEHEKAIAVFQQEIDNGVNTPIRDFARRTLPKIQKHKQVADSLAAMY